MPDMLHNFQLNGHAKQKEFRLDVQICHLQPKRHE